MVVIFTGKKRIFKSPKNNNFTQPVITFCNTIKNRFQYEQKREKERLTFFSFAVKF